MKDFSRQIEDLRKKEITEGGYRVASQTRTDGTGISGVGHSSQRTGFRICHIL